MSSETVPSPTEGQPVEDASPKPTGWVKFDEGEAQSSEQVTSPSVPNVQSSTVTIETAPVSSTPKRVVRPRPEDFTSSLDDSVRVAVELDQSSTSVAGGAAVINAETTHVSVNRSALTPVQSKSDERDSKSNLRPVNLNGAGTVTMHNTSIGVIRQGFANGDIIVTLLPINTRFPWITPAQFRPELVPEELMAQGLTLTVEDYVHVMELLTNDVRFHMYNVCYKRILVAWIFTAFVVLLALLFSGVTGLTLFGLGVMWLVLNAAAIFLCMWIKIKLNHNLERCMGAVNKHLLRHKIILGLDDRGKLSCHKVNLCFIYFETADCIKVLQDVIEREEREGRNLNSEETSASKRQRDQFQQRMDIEDRDIIIQGSQATRLSRKQERAEMLFLRYASRWVKQLVRHRLDLAVDGADRLGNTFPPPPPRHCATARCPCQFIEEHLKYKPRGNPILQVDIMPVGNLHFLTSNISETRFQENVTEGVSTRTR